MEEPRSGCGAATAARADAAAAQHPPGSVPVNLGQVVATGLPLVQRLFAQPDPIQDLQRRLLELQLLKALEGAAVPVGIVPWPEAVPVERQDLVLIGRRGSGKTATAVAYAQAMAQLQGLTPYGWDMPHAVAGALGLTPTLDAELRDAIIVADDASRWLGDRPSAPIRKAVTLARHRNVSWVWTSPHLHGLPKEILRSDWALGFKGPPGLGSRFDREEISDISLCARTMFDRFVDKSGPEWTLWHDGQVWAWADNQVPGGWSEAISRMWR